MKIEDSFRVEVPVEEAWKVLLDLERIAPCLPGAQLTEVEGDEYRGTVKIKVGPITAQYKGVAKIEEADEANRKVVLQAEGRDTRGQGNASATVVATLVPDGDGTTVNIDTDLNITGKVAQFGRGVMADVSSKLLGQFADNLKKDVLTGGPGSNLAADDAPTDPGTTAAGTTASGTTVAGTGSPADAGFASTGELGRRPAQDRVPGGRAHRPDGRGRRLGGEAVGAGPGRVGRGGRDPFDLQAPQEAPHEEPRHPPRRRLTLLGSNPCSIRPEGESSWSWASTRACRAVGTAWCGATARASAPSPTA